MTVLSTSRWVLTDSEFSHFEEDCANFAMHGILENSLDIFSRTVSIRVRSLVGNKEIFWKKTAGRKKYSGSCHCSAVVCVGANLS